MKRGRLKVADGQIVIECPSHVAIRLRRVFAGVQRYKAGVFAMTGTPLNAYELEWFRLRHPIDIEDDSAEAFKKLVSAHEKKLETIAEIEEEGYVPREFELAVPPREYQRIAAELAIRSGSLLIADDLGLGKTCSAICALTGPDALPALVVTMTHLTRQWERELAKFVPKLRVHRLRSTRPYRFHDVKVDRDRNGKRRVVTVDSVPDVIVTSYSKIHGWVENLAGLCRTIVFDEGAELRHDGTRKYMAAAAIAEKASTRISLSVRGDTTVQLAGDDFGSGWSGDIEEAWRIVARYESPSVRMEGEYEIVDVPPGIMTRGLQRGAERDRFGWVRVKRFIRHRVGDVAMVRIKAGGVSTEMTAEHSVFVADDETCDAAPAGNLQVGQVIPVDNGSGWETGPEKPYDVAAMAADVPRAQVVVDLRGVDRRDIGATAWQWQNFRREATYGARVPIDIYFRSRLTASGPVYVGRGKAAALPSKIMLSQWAYVLGFFIGDGWVSSSRVAFAVEQDRVTDFTKRLIDLDIGLRPKIRKMRGKSSEIRCSHLLFARVLEDVLHGAKCHEKRIPPAWLFTWPAADRKLLLDGLTDSDGHRAKRGNMIYYTTTSQNLADDVRVLARSLGVNALISRRKISDGGVVDGRKIVGRRIGYTVCWPDVAVRGGKAGNRHALKKWKDFMNEGPVRSVESIEIPPSEYVYDLEIAGHPSFIGNGLMCHNTATPVYNYGAEIFNVISVIAPDQLGTRREFFEEWCGGARDDSDNSKKARVSDPAALGLYLRESGLMIRRTRKEVGRELPDLSIIRYVVEADPESINRAHDDVAELAQRVLNRIGSPLERMQWGGELDYRLRQATGIAKAGAVAEFVRLLVEGGERVLLYGWHHEVYKLWTSAFVKAEIPYAMFTGEESDAQKSQSRDRFIDGRAKVLVMSLRAGAGLDGLQHACRTVVIGELDWSPQVHRQGIGRIHRDGQKEPVAAYYAVCEEGSDPVITDVLGIKEAQAAGIRDPESVGSPELVGASEDRIRKLAEDVLRRRGQQRKAG